MEEVLEEIKSMPTKPNEIFFPDDNPEVIKQGIGEILFEAIKKHANLVAQIEVTTGRSETYQTLLSNTIKTAQNLKLNGVFPGDIISLCSYNNLEYSAITLACFFTGIINAPMDATAPIRDLIHCVKLTCPKVIFCDKELENVIEMAVLDTKLPIKVVVFGTTEKNTPYSDYLMLREPEESFKVHKVTDMFETACIHFSSGTTGLPKAVCVNHSGLSYTVLQRTNKPFVPQRTMIATSPFWLSNNISLIGQVITGDTKIVDKQFDVKNIMKYVQNYKIQSLFITPVNGATLLEHPVYYKGYDISSLAMLITGGSLTSPKQFAEYAKVFPGLSMISGYGMTESGGPILGIQVQILGDVQPENQACIGVPIPGIRYRVVDPETEEILGPNQEGELRCKSVGLFKKYYKNPKATAEAFDKDGFLKTGDIVYYDEDLCFYYQTRIKDIFKYKGWHISPVIIEKELLEHPNVKEAVVFGVLTDIHGEYPTAAVTVYDKEKFDKQELKQFIQDRLPDRYHLLGGVFIVESIPRTSTGKIKRRYLSQYVQSMRHKL